MKRKVVKHGPSTLIISLPSSWAKKTKIVKGSDVEVREDDGRLIVSPGDSDVSHPMEIDIDVTNLDRTSLMFAIRSLYRLGYDTINIRFGNGIVPYYKTGEKLNVTAVIHKELSRLIGYEVIQEGENSCVIKDLEVVSMKDFDQVERRVFLLLMNAMSQLIEGAKKMNKSLLEGIEELHDTITKFVSYCLRLINKKGRLIQVENIYHYHTVALLDRMTDTIKYAGREIRSQKTALKPAVIEIIEAVSRHLRLFYELFYKFENDKVVEISRSRYNIMKKSLALTTKTKSYEIRIITSISSIPELVLELVETRIGLEYSHHPKVS